jgi:predicted transcriptional regulator
LEEAKLSGPKYGSIVIINAKATWIPNGILKTALRANKEKFKDTTYVLDYSKTFVNQWNFKDDSSSFMVINSEGLPIFRRDGKLSDQDIEEMISLIKANI